MDSLISRLQIRFPALRFTPGRQFYWAPESSEIFYKADANDQHAIWSLLHETGHALLQHATYQADFELLKLEVAAWERATALADWLGIAINADHIQDCLDTYRDWLYKRSICPSCHMSCLQQDNYAEYRCHNCHTTWHVSNSRFCRAYRRTGRSQAI